MNFFKFFAAILAVATISSGSGYSQSGNFRTGKALEVQYNILRELSVAFVDTVDVEKLANIGIDAMLRSLDPYTEYIPDENEEDLERS